MKHKQLKTKTNRNSVLTHKISQADTLNMRKFHYTHTHSLWIQTHLISINFFFSFGKHLLQIYVFFFSPWCGSPIQIVTNILYLSFPLSKPISLKYTLIPIAIFSFFPLCKSGFANKIQHLNDSFSKYFSILIKCLYWKFTGIMAPL